MDQPKADAERLARPMTEDLIETLEEMVAICEWSRDPHWSPDKLREFLGQVLTQARHGLDLAIDLALVRFPEEGEQALALQMRQHGVREDRERAAE